MEISIKKRVAEVIVVEKTENGYEEKIVTVDIPKRTKKVENYISTLKLGIVTHIKEIDIVEKYNLDFDRAIENNCLVKID